MFQTKMSYENDDLVWSKLGGYPFWPSFISPEPNTGLISKGMSYFKRY